MLKILCPKQVTASVLDIDLDNLSQKGITALILDLDNTLLRWDADQAPADMTAWVRSAVQRGFKVCITSNGMPHRVEQIAGQLGVPAIPKAIKPTKRPFRKALTILGVSSNQAAVIGDQVFTDILGGNRMSLHTILINPLGQKELRTTAIVRHVERRVLLRLDKKGLLQEGAVQTRRLSEPPDTMGEPSRRP